MSLVELRSVSRHYAQGDRKIEVLRAVDLRVERQDRLAIVGQSGSGKTTLLSCLTGLDLPSAGEVWWDEICVSKLSENQAARLRAERLGMVFQQFHLMPGLSALENVSLPLEIAGLGLKQSLERARAALEGVGLSSRVEHRPSQLSGGEKQRVAIARALVTEPELLVADEPSGSLDPETGAQVMEQLFEVVRKRDLTLVLVTHNLELASRCSRELRMEKGRLVSVRE
jgi:putative ABC transport system ATP-binding protein